MFDNEITKLTHYIYWGGGSLLEKAAGATKAAAYVLINSESVRKAVGKL